MDIALEEFQKAKKRLEGTARCTQLERSFLFSGMSGGEVFLKCENHQKTGSFKIRGASNKIAKMIESGKRAPVVASSAGNHAQGVACSASKFGLKSTIVMPITAPLAKIEATKGYGANVVLSGKCYDEAYAKACEICKEEGAEFIHPYDDIDVIAGQGTIALEILEEMPDCDIIVVPAGGGGLLSGIACAAKQIKPEIKVYGVQTENANAIAQSFQQKKKVTTDNASTIADGIAVNNPGNITVELINRYVDNVVTVSDNEIADAILLLLERSKEVVESAGASSVAAVINKKIDVEGKKVACILSGGNIDVSFMGSLIQRGLSSRFRRVEIYTAIKDGPGQIAAFTKAVSDEGGNITTFTIDKNSELLKPNESRVSVVCEVSGRDHIERIVKNLFARGYFLTTNLDYEVMYKELRNMKGIN